jgi:serine/threonine protein kinase
MSPGPPQRLGDYELLERIGHGGMGVVYKARQVSLNRFVALKMLPFGRFTRDDFVKRFQAEAEAAAQLQHPNIVAIHENGERDGQHYFAMEYIQGPNLAEAVRDQPMPVNRAVRLTRTIAGAVHYAHQHAILHRDLKPSNVLLDALDQPRVTDFGLAKRLTNSEPETPNLELTLSGQTLGSPHYTSPELAEGRPHDVGPPSDVYSLGALL